MNNFKIGDIVLFSWKPNYAPWCKGKIVANNFEICNLPYFFSKPVYYISEVDDNNNVLDNRKSFTIDKDSEYILKFLPGMEAMIGKSTCIKNIYTIDIEKEIPEKIDYDQKWKESIEKKLDDINDKLNKLFLWQRTWTDPYLPTSPWYDTNKPYCDNDKMMEITHVYNNSNIPLEEAHKYQETYSSSTDVDFDYKKYNDMSCNARMESTMFGNEILENNKTNKK